MIPFLYGHIRFSYEVLGSSVLGIIIFKFSFLYKCENSDCVGIESLSLSSTVGYVHKVHFVEHKILLWWSCVSKFDGNNNHIISVNVIVHYDNRTMIVEYFKMVNIQRIVARSLLGPTVIA